jgi:hypothetical protein
MFIKIYAQKNIFENFDIVDSLNQYLFLNVSRKDCQTIMQYVDENGINGINTLLYKESKKKLLEKFKGFTSYESR